MMPRDSSLSDGYKSDNTWLILGDIAVIKIIVNTVLNIDYLEIFFYSFDYFIDTIFLYF